MRVEEKSAEAVLAKKAGNAAGAKGRRTKYKELEEELDAGEISDSNHGSNNYGSHPWALAEDAVQPLGAAFGETMRVFCEPFDGERCTRR